MVHKPVREVHSVQSKGNDGMQQRRMKGLKIAWYLAGEWSDAWNCGREEREGQSSLEQQFSTNGPQIFLKHAIPDY